MVGKFTKEATWSQVSEVLTVNLMSLGDNVLFQLPVSFGRTSLVCDFFFKGHCFVKVFKFITIKPLPVFPVFLMSVSL